MIYNIPVRLIAVYGLQETCSVDDREEFYDELSTEIENCSMYADNPIITGDFNAKIEFQDPDIAHLSANGKCQCHVIEKYSLQVLNFHPKCTGKWTRVRDKNGITEKSVIDYILTNHFMADHVDLVLIDEERLMTPFKVSKTKNSINKISTDHHHSN